MNSMAFMGHSFRVGEIVENRFYPDGMTRLIVSADATAMKEAA